MKKIIQGAALAGALFVLTGCVAGTVEDKRAPGMPGEKMFQIEINRDQFIGPKRVWVTVPEEEWDTCDIDTEYPDCAG